MGIKLHCTKLSVNVNTGAKKKRNLLARIGTITSFNDNFKPSAKACKTPQKPTTAGPRRRWIEPITLRSTRVKKAMAIITTISVIKLTKSIVKK